MGSASGALYSANVSVRLLPLSDVYLPFSQLASPSKPLGRLLDGGLGDVLKEIHGAGGAGGIRPHFKYNNSPLPREDDSLFAPFRALFGVKKTSVLDQGDSAAAAWEHLRAEFLKQRGEDVGDGVLQACQIAESGAIKLPTDLFCVNVDGRDLPVFLE